MKHDKYQCFEWRKRLVFRVFLVNPLKINVIRVLMFLIRWASKYYLILHHCRCYHKGMPIALPRTRSFLGSALTVSAPHRHCRCTPKKSKQHKKGVLSNAGTENLFDYSPDNRHATGRQLLSRLLIKSFPNIRIAYYSTYKQYWKFWSGSPPARG